MVSVIWVTYKCSWKWGLLTLAMSLAMTFYVLLPIDNSDIFTLASLAVSGLVIVGIMGAAARTRPS